MTRRHRYLSPIALALALVAVAVPIAQAGAANPKVAAGAEAKGYAALSQAILNTSRLQSQGRAAGAEAEGYAALSQAILNTSRRQSQSEVATTSGFDWGDAGIGAAAALGLMLFVGGMGIGLVVHGRSRQPTHA